MARRKRTKKIYTETQANIDTNNLSEPLRINGRLLGRIDELEKREILESVQDDYAVIEKDNDSNADDFDRME